MAVNNYTHISWSPSSIIIFSTDAKLLDDIIVEVKKIVPTCVINEVADIYNNKSKLHISKLEDKDHRIGIWLLRWLGQFGWEVFEDKTDGLFSGAYSLRKHE